jgi:lipid-binding SYLF domain-containing protein
MPAVGAEGANMKKKLTSLVATLVLLACTPAWAVDKQKDEDRLTKSGTVLNEILDIPDNIPRALLDKAECVVVFPSVLKAAFIFGASYGRGSMTCRSGKDFDGPWGAPTMMALEGGSFGLQLGGEATDFVLLIMNDRGANAVLSSKVKLGGDASAVAGPVGREASAETDLTMRAEILSYSRARGLFAGISLAGSTIRPDNGANEKIYGRRIPAKDIALSGTIQAPPSANKLLSTLNARTPQHKS